MCPSPVLFFENLVGQVLLLKTLVGKVLRPEDTSAGSRGERRKHIKVDNPKTRIPSGKLA